MKVVHRYIFFRLLGLCAAIVVLLCTIAILLRSLDLMRLLVSTGLGVVDIASLLGMRLPQLIQYILPLAFFAAVVHVFIDMKQHHELTTLEQSGVSNIRLALPVLSAGLVMWSVLASLTLYITPMALKTYSETIHASRSDFTALPLRERRFIALGETMTLYVTERPDDFTLEGIFFYDRRNPERHQVLSAQRGHVQIVGSQKVLRLHQGSQIVLTDEARTHPLTFEDYEIALDIETMGHARWPEPKERTIGALFFADMTDPNNRQFARHLFAEGHKRLSEPFLGWVFGLIALVCVLRAPVYGRRHGLWWGGITASFLMLVMLGLHFASFSAVRASPSLFPLPYLLVSAGIIAPLVMLRQRR